MTERHTTRRDGQPRKQRVTFTLEAPQAQSIHVTGTFCDWQTDSCALKQDRKGTWKATLPLSLGRHEYRFLVDGEWRDDPSCVERIPNPFGTENCVLHVLREAAQSVRAAVETAGTP